MPVTCIVADPAGLVRRVNVLVESPEVVVAEIETTIKRPEMFAMVGQDEIVVAMPGEDDAGRHARVRFEGLPFPVEEVSGDWGRHSWSLHDLNAVAGKGRVLAYFVASRNRARPIYVASPDGAGA